MMTLKIEMGDSNVLFTCEKNGEIITFDSLTKEERYRIVNALAGGFSLFSGQINVEVEQEASEVQFR